MSNTHADYAEAILDEYPGLHPASVAQVPATLALAEEQRTANLIAIARGGTGVTGAQMVQARSEVLARLGLEVATVAETEAE